MLYGIDVPSSLIDYSRKYYPLIDYVSKDFSGEITLDKAFLYIILLSIATRKYPLSDFTFNLAKIREEPIFLFDHEICEKIASKFSVKLSEIALRKLTDMLPARSLRESLRRVQNMDDFRTVLEEHLLFAIVESTVSALNRARSMHSEYDVIQKIKESKYLDVSFFGGVLSEIICEISNISIMDSVLFYMKYKKSDELVQKIFRNTSNISV